MARKEKRIVHTHEMSHYDLDGMEFEEGIKYLRQQKKEALKTLKILGAQDNIQVYFVAENDNWYGDPSFEFKLKCSGTRMETDEELAKRRDRNARAAEARKIKAMKKEEAELKRYLALKEKYGD